MTMMMMMTTATFAYLHLRIDGKPRSDVFDHDVRYVIDSTSHLLDVTVHNAHASTELHDAVSTTGTPVFDEHLRYPVAIVRQPGVANYPPASDPAPPGRKRRAAQQPAQIEQVPATVRVADDGDVSNPISE